MFLWKRMIALYLSADHQRLWIWIRELLLEIKSLVCSPGLHGSNSSVIFPQETLHLPSEKPILHHACVSLPAIVCAFTVKNKRLDAKSLEDKSFFLKGSLYCISVFLLSIKIPHYLLLLLVKFNSNLCVKIISK